MKTLILLALFISCGKDPSNKININESQKVVAQSVDVQSCEDGRLLCSSKCVGTFREQENCNNACFSGQNYCVRDKCDQFCGEKMLPINKYDECRNECFLQNQVTPF